MPQIDILDTQELTCFLLGIDFNQCDLNSYYLEDKLKYKYSLSLKDFNNLLNDIIPLIQASEQYIGLVNNKGEWLVRTHKRNRIERDPLQISLQL